MIRYGSTAVSKLTIFRNLVRRHSSAPALPELRLGDCCGCGANLHFHDDSKPGYLPKHIIDNLHESFRDSVELGIDAVSASAEAVHSLICMRCHQLTHNGFAQGNMRNVISEDFRTSLKSRFCLENGRSSVIIKLVDLVDFHGSMFADVIELIGKDNPVILAANKFDLLPTGASTKRIRSWVKNEAALMRLPIYDVHIVCSRTGEGLSSLIDNARQLAEMPARDIYVVGSCNVGKSTFINCLLNKSIIKGVGRGSRKATFRLKDGRVKETTRAIPVTASSVAGTTLGLIPFKLRGPASVNEISLFDTPGVYADLPIHRRLTEAELRLISHGRKIMPVTYRLEKGQSLLLAGLARIDHIDGLPFLYTSFVSRDVVVHVTQTARAENILSQRPDIYKIPKDSTRVVSSLMHYDFKISGKGWAEASQDVAFDGLGWVSLTGCGSSRIRVFGIGSIRLRHPLMPFDARDSARRFTG